MGIPHRIPPPVAAVPSSGGPGTADYHGSRAWHAMVAQGERSHPAAVVSGYARVVLHDVALLGEKGERAPAAVGA